MRQATYVSRVLLLLFVAAAVNGCGDGDGKGAGGGNVVSGAKLTAQRVQLPDTSAFADVLRGAATKTSDGRAVTFDVYDVGRLSLPSGRVVAADGLIMFDAEPFTRSVSPGSYPLTLAVARLGDDQRIAFAQLRFSDRRVVKWELAVTPGQDPGTLKPDEILGYGVDSGTGSFADPGAQEILSAEGSEKLVERATAEMRKVYEPTRDWVLVDTPKGSAAMFSSGWGDGGYASYFGLDDAGNPVTLVTDFAVVDWKR